ncbi:MAG: 4Fe-4S binding protein [Candidatus Cloacimonadales bacterium]|nr:4Fe-4S binding protein [Candidatus Cloacimonadales bacterium]
MSETSKNGVLLKTKENLQKSILQFFQDAIKKQIFDAVLLPMKVPSGDSFAWIMIKDKEILKDAQPLAPIMPVNAAKALKRYTRKGKGKFKIAALMRPCEIRATIELTKLNQVNLEDITLFSYDCVGAFPMQDYIADPSGGDEKFGKLIADKNFNFKDVKPVCQICDKFSLSANDLHFAFSGAELILVSNSEKGEKLLTDLEWQAETDLAKWQKQIEELKKLKSKNRAETFEIVKGMVEGFDNLVETFANCIGCHNCGSSCPICYCRQCYFDTSVAKPNSDIIMLRAEERGAVSLPLDRIMFHTGRMAHMSLSCVSCGLCSDACPVNIPVARIFSYVASQTQKTFEYEAGASVGDALPMKEYKLEELGELGELVKSAEAQEENHE